MHRRAGAIIAACLLLFGLPSVAGAGSFKPGASGIGDGYFPLDGNGGYDVDHYDLSISYDPKTDALRGIARIDATATQNLSTFNLDRSEAVLLGHSQHRTVVGFLLRRGALHWNRRLDDASGRQRTYVQGHRLRLPLLVRASPIPRALPGEEQGWLMRSSRPHRRLARCDGSEPRV